MGRLADLTGARFSRWTVKMRAPNSGRKTMWVCICDCGEQREVNASDLRCRKSKSCGCLQKEKASAAHMMDLTGMIFGRLSVIARQESSKISSWICRCECGKTHVAQSQYLRGGQTTSCGCFASEKTSAMHLNPEFRRKRLDGISDYYEHRAFMLRMEQEAADWESDPTTTTPQGDHT